MKTIPTPKVALLTCLLSLLTLSALAQSGTWTNRDTSVWSDATNWLDAVIADGVTNTATFSADLSTNLPTTTNVTINVDTPRTIGHLTFVDTDVATPGSLGNWSLTDGGFGLILDDTNQVDSITTLNLATGTSSNLVTGWETATLGVNLTSTNTFVKAGAGYLILNPPAGNTLSGGMIISNGMVQLGVNNQAGTANTATPGTGPIIFRGGSLRLQNAAIPGNNPGTGGGGVPGLAVPILVEPGQTGAIYMTCRSFPALGSVVSGGGTLNLIVDFVRDNLGGDWTGFTGRVVVASSTRQNSDLRFNSSYVPSSWGNNSVSFTNNGVNANTVFMYSPGLPVGTIVEIGEMEASVPGIVTVISANTTVNNGGGNSAPFVLQVGALNTDASFSGNFNAGAGSVGIIKVGTGNWTLNGPTVEYTGITVVSNGVLQFGSGTTGKPGRSAVISNYSVVAFGRTDTALAVTNIIDGSGALIQRGSGRTTLSPTGGNNTYTGKTYSTNGTLAIAAEAALGPAPGGATPDQLTLNGGSLAATVSLSIDDANRGITLGANGGGLGADGANTLTVVNTIAGAGNLTINNTGTVAPTAANTYSGKTIAQSGTLLLAAETALGTAPGSATADQLTLNGGTLRSSATFAIDDANRGVTIGSSGGTISPDASTTLTISEPIVGSGTLTKAGAGTLTINGADTHSGSTLINQGVLALGASGSSTSPSIVIAGGATFDVTALGGGFTLASGQTVSGNGTVAGSVTSGTGSTLSAGTSVGQLNVTGNLTLSGGTNNVEISSSTNDVINVTGDLSLSGVSTINLTLLSSLPAGTYQLIKYGGTLLSGGAGNLALGGYPASRLVATLVHNAGTKSIDLVITGTAASLVWKGGLNGNAWNVALTTNWLNGLSDDYFLNGDAVTFNNVGAANSSVNLVGSLIPDSATVNSTTDYTFSGAGKISGLATLAKDGGNKLTVLTTNDNTGAVAINSGTVQVGDGTASGSLGSGNITDNAALVYNVPGSVTVGNQISGSGSLTVNAGTVILTANNSYGATTIDTGTTVQVGNGGATGSVGTGAVTDNGALVYRRTGTVTNAGSISGSGSLAVQGSGTVVLAANNSYSGPTTVDTGTLQVGADGVAGSLGTAGSVTLTNGGTLAFRRSDDLTNAVAVTGTNGTLAQFGTGTLVITNDANNYGPTLITAGKLQLGDAVNASGQLGRGTITVNTPGSLVLNRPDVYTLSNLVAGSGSVVYAGPTNNATTPAGANTYSGGTTISNSSVLLVPPVTSPAENGFQTVNGGAFGTGTLTFLGTSSLELAGANAQDPFGNGTGAFGVPVNVPAGQTANLYLPGRFTFSANVSGAGTINYGVNYVRGNVTAIWTNFTGTLNIMTNVVNTTGTTLWDFRPFTVSGFPVAKIHMVAGVTMYWRGAANSVVPIGELSGDEGTFITGTGGAEGGNAVTWRVGGLGTSATYGGAIGGTVLVGLIKEGAGEWSLSGINTYLGNTTVSNGVLALTTNSALANGEIQNSPIITVVSPGALGATNRTDGTFPIGLAAAQTLQGNGSVLGGLLVGPSGTLSPGFSIGTTTATGGATNNGAYLVEVNLGATQTSDRLVAQDIDVNTSTITVTNSGTIPLTNGSTFQILQASGVIVGTPTSVTGGLPPGPGSAWDISNLTVNGTITAVFPPSPTLTNTVSGGGTTLDLAWDAAYLGWRLYQQTNSLSVGITSGGWEPVLGTEATTSTTVPIDTSIGTVFYRLSYP